MTDTKKEYPFDFDNLELITVTDKLQSDYFDNDYSDFDEDNDAILSDNSYDFKN